MSVALLDVNALVALVWPAHESHEKIQKWFQQHAKSGWATCPLTQAALVRIVSNPAFSPNAVSVSDAIGLLKNNVEHPFHRFWRDDVGFVEAATLFTERIVGHRQITDAYLLGLAVHKKGKLLTLDRAMRSLAGAAMMARGIVEIL
jgi:toxin-antitoxin system PIN domain toxin